MRYNGLQLIIRMAVDKLDEPMLNRFADALVLGAVREDVCLLPGARVWEHWSLSHFSGSMLGGGFIPLLSPGAPGMTQHYYDAALKSRRQGETGKSFIQLGRASHLLIDMACPVHAHRVPHFNDGYEWYIEAHCDSLRRLDFEIPLHYSSVRATAQGLARHTRSFTPDRSNHHWGRLLKSLGLRRTLSRQEFADQAEQIVPVAAGHLAAVYQRFLQQSSSC